MRAAVIIPARYESSRFPGKPLAILRGKPMIHWVYERARQAQGVEEVIVATDDLRIFRAVEDLGGRAQMTSPHHRTGTDRVAEIARGLTAELIVNLQGDEPLIRPEMIELALRPWQEDPLLPMGTLKVSLESPEEMFDPNVVKVVTDQQDFALYFSRSPIPYDRGRWMAPTMSGRQNSPAQPELATPENENGLQGEPGIFSEKVPRTAFKHIGLYVYRRDFLLAFAQLPSTPLERLEQLEQLRALEHGYRIKVVTTHYAGIGVDTPEDLEKAERFLS